jgi:hypothetical protein
VARGKKMARFFELSARKQQANKLLTFNHNVNKEEKNTRADWDT